MLSSDFKSFVWTSQKFNFFLIFILPIIIPLVQSFPSPSNEPENLHSDSPSDLEIESHSHSNQKQRVSEDNGRSASTQDEPVHTEPNKEEDSESHRRMKQMKMFGRNMDGEAAAGSSDSSKAPGSKGVLTFGGYRVSDKKRVQRFSVEDMAPGDELRKKTKKKKHHEAEGAKEKKYAKIDQHCGLGYNWDANEKVCVQIPRA